jgi:hypothetical protein
VFQRNILILLRIEMKVKITGSSEVLAAIHSTTWYNISEYHALQK